MLLCKYSVTIVYRSVWPEHSAVRFRFQDDFASGGGVPPALHQREDPSTVVLWLFSRQSVVSTERCRGEGIHRHCPFVSPHARYCHGFRRYASTSKLQSQVRHCWAIGYDSPSSFMSSLWADRIFVVVQSMYPVHSKLIQLKLISMETGLVRVCLEVRHIRAIFCAFLVHFYYYF